jgi:hypothetical protein
MPDARTRRSSSSSSWLRAALCAAVPVLWLALVVAGPASAQTNSPAGNQPTGQTPSQGGTNSQAPANAGGDTGNRTTPGNGGATGGGSSGAGQQDTGGGGSAGIVIGVVALLAVIGVAVAITTRHRRVMDEVESGAPAAR